MEQRHREIALKRPREHCQNAPVFSLSNSPYVNYPPPPRIAGLATRLDLSRSRALPKQIQHSISPPDFDKIIRLSKNDQRMNGSNTTIGALHVLIVSNVPRICALCALIFASQTRAAKGYQTTFSLKFA